MLIEALNKYQGSLILVSHDRYFISKTANKIWEIDDHIIREFNGGYDEWADWKERKLKAEQAAKSNGASKQAKKNPPAPAMEKPVEAKPETPSAAPAKVINKEVKKELQKQQRLFGELEQKMARLTEKKKQLELALGAPETYSDRNIFAQTEKDYKSVSEELIRVNREYEKVFELIVELEAG